MNLRFLLTGGPILWTLVLCGAIAALVFVVRWFALRRAVVDYNDFITGVANVLAQGNVSEALLICDENPGPLSTIVAEAIKARGDTPEGLRVAVNAAGRREVGRYERRIAPLANIAQLAPLLGLLGTVFGLVAVAESLGGAAVVSRVDLMNDVVKALVTAGAGLAVAIPSQLMYEILRVRLDRITADLEVAASRIVSILISPGEGK